ncbi:MAG TPA: biotin/lipoyl-containing protein [Segetibacter sp.]
METDKATMELESYKNGTLLYQGAGEGEKIQVNDLLCIIGEQGMNIDAILAAASIASIFIPASPIMQRRSFT